MNDEMIRLARAARSASFRLAATDNETRNHLLVSVAEALEANKETIFEANRADVDAAKAAGIADQLIHRLGFNENKLRDVTAGLRALSEMPDPIHRVTRDTELADGLNLTCVTCPIGVIGVIFESRPDALVQIAGLCLKSGNAVLLKGGIEALRTNQALFDIIEAETARTGFPAAGWIGLLKSREEVSEMLGMDDLIDLIIPRGSNAFVKYIMDNTRIPVLGHSSGICHVYLDRTADPDMAARLAVDAKIQYPAACNAAETLLVHADAEDALLAAGRALAAAGVQLKADARAGAALKAAGVETEPVVTDDYSREYGDLIMNVHMVDSVDEAIEHINHYGSHHTDCIVTEDPAAAERFFALVDSAGVYQNCSTRFADGYRYGFGAEVGISTGKIHARGPMGLDGLCSYKYILKGNGDCVADFASGSRRFTHVNRMSHSV
ncbi:MAG: glutamate-5-semialdehyde dehydrogenase [Clostridia bacterium]|nr:glutamate-5-semialdehyde dehydrogenase [Clostridia bacterium]